MASTERPTDMRKCGLWQSVVHNGAINPHAWRRAESDGDIVGTCRSCGGYLIPDRPPIDGSDELLAVVWFFARCVTCGHEVASPNGKLCNKAGHPHGRRS